MAKRKRSTSVKEAADRAARKSAGVEETEPRVPIDPPTTASAKAKVAKRRGRHSHYTPELGRAICKMLAAGMTLQAVCRRPSMPHERTVRDWALDVDHPFSPQYARAREIGYHRMADEIIEIADAYTIKDVLDPHVVQRDRLRIETRKWLMAKALPKMYGEKTEVNVNADHKHHHTTEPLSESSQWLAKLLGSGADSEISQSRPH
jgi:hypothetical protein